MTEHKYSIPDDHEWADEQDDDEDHPPAAQVDSHSLVILHRAHAHVDGDRDIPYRYVFDDGEAIGILRSHRLAESNQFDPMGAAAPYEVPGDVRELVAEEMGVDHWLDVVDTERCEAFAEVDR